MRLLKLIAGGIVTIAVALMISYWPYNFVEQLEPTYKLSWTKNPVGKKVKNSRTGIETDIFLFTETEHHWDLAGEVVLDWEDKKIHADAYFYDIRADQWLVALHIFWRPGGPTLVYNALPTEGAARLYIFIKVMKQRGLSSKIEHAPAQVHKINNETKSVCPCGCQRHTDKCDNHCPYRTYPA